MIERFAGEQEQPASDALYPLLEELRERNYADVLKPLDLNSTVVTKARRTEFQKRVANYAWRGLRTFHDALTAWYTSWSSQTRDPNIMLNMIAAMAGGNGGMLSPLLQSTPDTQVLRSVVKDLASSFNRVFAGLYGIPVARALAFDAARINKRLNDPNIPAAVGATSRDDMLRKLEITIPDWYVRMERSTYQYVISAFNMDNVDDAQLPTYAVALYVLGTQISWDAISQLNAGAPPMSNGNSTRNPASFVPFDVTRNNKS
jgi:hypothetical protein